MKLKRLMALACVAALGITSLSGVVCSAEEMETIVFATPLTSTVDMERIEVALNEITEPEIGVHVEIEGITLANYANQIGLMQSGGEQLDVMGFFNNYSNLLANNQLLCMDDYIDEYGAGIKEVVADKFLKSTSKDGSLYGIPTYNGMAASLNVIIRKDLIEELSLPVDKLYQATNFEEFCENLDLITEMYAAIKEAHPELVCVVPSSTAPNSLGIVNQIPFVDRLNDGYGALMIGEADTVTNMYESEEFAKLCDYMYQWNQAGYILEDATTTQEAQNTYVQNGRTAGYFIIGEEGQAEQVTTATGVEVEAFKIAAPYLTTTSCNSIGFSISATSKHPEAAMKFINMMYTSADVINLLAWGIEGEDWILHEDGTVGYPEGVDSTNSKYNLNMDWYFGNQFLGYIWGEGRDTTVYERLDANNKNAASTPVMGYSFDSTVVATEMAALSNVLSEYLPGLSCGAVDPATQIQEFNDALYAAGLQRVMDEKQAQMDAWKATNK